MSLHYHCNTCTITVLWLYFIPQQQHWLHNSTPKLTANIIYANIHASIQTKIQSKPTCTSIFSTQYLYADIYTNVYKNTYQHSRQNLLQHLPTFKPSEYPDTCQRCSVSDASATCQWRRVSDASVTCIRISRCIAPMRHWRTTEEKGLKESWRMRRWCVAFRGLL